MNYNLTKEIINHIFLSFSIVNDKNTNINGKSLKSKEFLINKNISFQDEYGNIIKNNIWGSEVDFGDEEICLRFILADCTILKENPEYALIISMKNSSTYGLYLTYDNGLLKYPLIGLSLDNINWIEANILSQTALLQSLEMLKDINYNINVLSNYENDYNILLDFIKYYNNYYEIKNEG